MTPQEIQDFLRSTCQAAKTAGHIWPEFAACEAALESAWGKSELAIKAFNLFGRKQSMTFPVFSTIDLPTHEWQHGELVPTTAHWVKYPDYATCFQDRMALLRRLAPVTKDGQLLYPGYAAALGAPDGETFVLEVSKNWSTDPLRGQKVMSIYKAHQGQF